MGLFKNILTNNSPEKILHIDNFDARYQVITKNELIMGKENPAIKLETAAEIIFSQDADIFKLTNTIETFNIKGFTENEQMNTSLQQILLLNDISKKIVIERNLQGKLNGVLNVSTLRKDWKIWKECKLKEIFNTQTQQQKFIENYEKGLEQLNEGLESNFQYVLLMPEIYHFKKPVAGHAVNKTSERKLPSKLVADMMIRYNFQSTIIEDHKDTIQLTLSAHVTNDQQLSNFLVPMYEKHKNFSIADYKFQVNINYILKKDNSKIIAADFQLCEKLHNHLFYKFNIELKEI